MFNTMCLCICFMSHVRCPSDTSVVPIPLFPKQPHIVHGAQLTAGGCSYMDNANELLHGACVLDRLDVRYTFQGDTDLQSLIKCLDRRYRCVYTCAVILDTDAFCLQ